MKRIFEEVNVGGVKMRNRLVRSATFEMGLSDIDGRMTERYEEFYAPLAEGGAGGLITGMMSVYEGGGLTPNATRIFDDSFVPSFKRLADVVHAAGSTIIVQVNHCGVKSMSMAGPSEVEVYPGKPHSKAMTKEDIAAVTKAFGEAAARCKQAGADAVQLHGAHGYLLSQFLSPVYNKRTDEYGGPIENRARFLLEVYDEARRQVGPDYPLWVKINYADLEEPSITPEECIWVCQELERRGINAIEVSAGLGNGRDSSPSRRVAGEAGEGYFADAARAVAAAVKVPVLSVGGFRTPAVIEAALQTDGIEAVSLCRPLIREPGLPNRWLSGDASKATCISCSKCFKPSERFGCYIDMHPEAG